MTDVRAPWLRNNFERIERGKTYPERLVSEITFDNLERPTDIQIKVWVDMHGRVAHVVKVESVAFPPLSTRATEVIKQAVNVLSNPMPGSWASFIVPCLRRDIAKIWEAEHDGSEAGTAR